MARSFTPRATAGPRTWRGRGRLLLDRYPNDQRAAMLRYHDHVMGATRFTCSAGLAGLWIVRDDRERELDLPEGPPYELPLL